MTSWGPWISRLCLSLPPRLSSRRLGLESALFAAGGVETVSVLAGDDNVVEKPRLLAIENGIPETPCVPTPHCVCVTGSELLWLPAGSFAFTL